MKSPWDDLVPPLRICWPDLGWRGYAILAILAIALPFACTVSAQERPRVVFDCQQFATYARGMATLRDVGADRDKVLAELRSQVRPGMMLAVLEREVKLVWAAKQPRIEAEHGAYKRCQAQLGDMGHEG